MTSFGTFLNQAIPAAQVNPAIAPLMADMMKYVASQYRAGRELATSIDTFADQMKQQSQQPQGNPQADQVTQAHQADMQSKALDAKLKQDAASHEAQLRQSESAERVNAIKVKAFQDAQKHQQDMELGSLQVQKAQLEVQKVGGQIDATARKADAHEAEVGQRMDLNAQKAAESLAVVDRASADL
jgi:hypothetical protein